MADDEAAVRSRKHLLLLCRRRAGPASSERNYDVVQIRLFLTCLLIANSALGQTGQLEIKTPWARATPGHAENGAAYFTIVSPTADRLTAVSSPVAKKAELHTMSMEGGVMRMRPLAAIDIPAGQTVTLSPGGMHIMLLGLTQPLHQGQSFPLTLSFGQAGPRQVTRYDRESRRHGARRASDRITADAHASLKYPPARNLCNARVR
jgi:periplasmic copper chaperone A